MSQEKIAVLGAGPMGLAVAYQLLQDGYKPVIFEADDRVGGMTACFDFEGLSIERYYHFHCTSDHAFLAMLDELGIAEKMRWKETKMGYYYQGRVNPWGNPIALLKFPGLGIIDKIRYGLHAFCSTKRDNWKKLDQIEATSWIRKWIGPKAYEILWQKLFDYKFYDFADQLSAAWIWSRIRRIGRSRYNLFREKLGHLEGGSDTLLTALQAHIEKQGGEFRFKSPISKVLIENNQLQGVEVNGEKQAFSKVISTIPLPYVSRIMPDLPQEVLDKYNAIKNIAVVCVIAKLKQKLTENFWLNVNDPEMDIPGLVEYSNLRDLDDHVVYVPFYMPGEHAKFQEPNEYFLDKVKSYLKTINPKLQDDDFIAIRASRYRYSQPICPPGFLENLPDMKLPIADLWAADTSYYYPDDRGISESIAFGRDMARKAIA